MSKRDSAQADCDALKLTLQSVSEQLSSSATGEMKAKSEIEQLKKENAALIAANDMYRTDGKGLLIHTIHYILLTFPIPVSLSQILILILA
jgi:hypothetical protein